MISRHVSALLVFLVAGFLLAACSAAPLQQPAVITAPVSQVNSATKPTPTAHPVEEESEAEAEPQSGWEEVPRVDEQGAVVVEITPINLNSPGQTIDFQVSMNTHSVDLSMDLAALSTLNTDTGYSVQALSWDGPSGGHHVSGYLSFPVNIDDIELLTNAKKLTLTLTNVDAAERVFVWEK